MHLSTLLIPLSALFPLILALPNPAHPLHPLYPRQNATAGETPVQRAGLVLNPEAAEEANPRDETATRAFAATNVKTSDGRCLTIDPTAGDFRQNLIPVQLQACAAGAEGQQWDVITKGQHVAQEGAMLIVSALVCCLPLPPLSFWSRHGKSEG